MDDTDYSYPFWLAWWWWAWWHGWFATKPGCGHPADIVCTSCSGGKLP